MQRVEYKNERNLLDSKNDQISPGFNEHPVEHIQNNVTKKKIRENKDFIYIIRENTKFKRIYK